jgi:outer membrane protein, multidrug efflux system
MRKRLMPLLLCVTLAACAVGPDFKPPEAGTPPGWFDIERVQNPPDDMRIPHAISPSVVSTQADPDPRWWRQFNDTTLDSLIDRAIAGNLDLQGTVLRIATAREQTIAAGAQGLPQLSANASYKREQLGIEGLLKSEGVFQKTNQLGANAAQVQQAIDSATGPVNLFQDGFDASWELDLFGRVRRSVESSKAET